MRSNWSGPTNTSVSFGFSSTAGFSAQNLRVFVLAAYLLALVAIITLPALRKQRGYQALVVLTITDMVALTFLDGAKRWYYMIYVTPLLGIVLASVITWAWQERVIRRTFITGGFGCADPATGIRNRVSWAA